MWAHRLVGPGRLEPVEVDALEAGDLRADEVLCRYLAGAICGSDLPSFLGRRNPIADSHGVPGYPMHEVVGEVLASTSPDVAVGDRIVGWADNMRGLAERFVARADSVVVLDDRLPSEEATVAQPLCTVLYTLDRLPRIDGLRAAVIGQGPLGILFSHVLADRGATVTGVDRVDRRDVAAAFGVADPVWEQSTTWAAGLGDEGGFDIVVEAVGHQAGTLNDAVEAVADGGTIVAFGVPDDTHYGFAFERFFRRNATLIAGVAGDRRRSLEHAVDYLRRREDLLAPYITHRLALADAQRAYELAATPAAGRLKIVLS